MHEEVVYGPLYTYCSQCFTRWPCDFEDMRADLAAARQDNDRLREALADAHEIAVIEEAGEKEDDPLAQWWRRKRDQWGAALAATAPDGTRGGGEPEEGT